MLKKSINFSHSVSSVSFAKQQGLSGHPNDNAEYQITLYDQGMDVKLFSINKIYQHWRFDKLPENKS